MNTITLSNGTKIAHRKLENGATEAFICGPQEIADSREMTDTEWTEYCATIAKQREEIRLKGKRGPFQKR